MSTQPRSFRPIKFPLTINLTGSEVMMAAQPGIQRIVESVIEENRPETHGGERGPGVWGRHIEGALGEFAVGKALGYFWPGKGIIYAPNIPTRHCVTTTEKPCGCCIVHRNARDSDVYWLVRGFLGDYTVEGWIYGRDAKNEDWWKNKTKEDRPAFYVHTAFLHKEWFHELVLKRDQDWKQYVAALKRKLEKLQAK